MQIASEEIEELLGAPVDIDPGEAMLYCVAMASQELAWIQKQLAKVTEPTHLVPEGNMGGPSKGWTGMQEQFDIWILARQTAVERLARYSKMAIDAGIAERMVSMAEKLGDLIAPMLQGILSDLQLTPEQKTRAPHVVQAHMLQLESRTGKAA